MIDSFGVELAEEADQAEWRAAEEEETLVLDLADLGWITVVVTAPAANAAALPIPVTAATPQQPRFCWYSARSPPQHDPPQAPQRSCNGDG